jgi:hypothetical protein
MTLLWILLGSVAGVSAMIGLNIYLKIWTPTRLTSLADAHNRLDADAIGFDPGPGVLAPDGSAALVEEAGGQRFGLLAARGDSIVIRYLTPGMVEAARLDEDGEMSVRLRDFSFTPVRIPFEDRETARVWADKLNKLQD